MRNTTILLAVLAVVALTVPAQAATRTWNNDDPSDNYWASDDNWVEDVAPVAADNVTINCDTSNKCEVQTGTTANFNHLYVGNGAVGHLDVYGDMTQNAGGWKFMVGRNSVTAQSMLTQYSGDIDADYTVHIGFADWASSPGTARGKYEIKGGSIELPRGRGLVLGGEDVGGSAPPAGATSAGIFKIVGGRATSAIKAGYYEQSSSSILELVFDGDADPIEAIVVNNWNNDGVELAGTLTVTGSAPVGTYTIIDYSTTAWTWLSGTFDTVSLPSGWSIAYGDGTTDKVTITVPEPATMVLLGIGGIGVLIRRKRR